MPKTKARKKTPQSTIDAIQFDGKNQDEVRAFGNGKIAVNDKAVVVTLSDGTRTLTTTDWVVKSNFGELFVLSELEFEALYEVD